MKPSCTPGLQQRMGSGQTARPATHNRHIKLPMSRALLQICRRMVHMNRMQR